MIRELIGLCRGKAPLYIQTHNNPDADAIASACGLQALLSRFGIAATVRYVGKADRVSTKRFIALCEIELECFDGTYADTDSVILVDCQKGNGNLTMNGGSLIGCLDHHLQSSEGYLWSRIEQVGACASLVTDFFLQLGCPFDKEIATVLLYGIKMDTLKFTRGITRLDIGMFQELFDKVDSNKMRILETGDIALEDLIAFGTAIRNIRVINDIGISYIPFDCPDALIAVLSEFMLGIDELSITVVLSQRPGGIKLSVRTILEFFNAGEFTERALEGLGSGGGHASFAGGFIPIGNLDGIPQYDYPDFLTERLLKTYRHLLLDSAEFSDPSGASGLSGGSGASAF